MANESYFKLAGYEAKLASDPSDMWLTERVALLYAKQNKVEPAMALIKKAEAADPDGKKGSLAEACYAEGNAYQGANDNEKAIPLFLNALRLTSDDFIKADGTMDLAQAYMATNHKDRAKPLLLEVKNQPKAPDYYKQIADAMLKQLGG